VDVAPKRTTGTKRLLAAIATAAALVGGLILPLAVAAPAQAATGCSYANTTPNNGDHAATICWFNFAGFNSTLAGTDDGQPMSVTLDGGYVATFDVKLTEIDDDTINPITVAARATPLETRFAFGSNAYRGVINQPALYSQPGQGTKGGIVTFDNISVVDGAGIAVTGFSFVAADVEDNVSGESFVWRSDKPIREIERLAPAGSWGCKAPVGIGTTEVSCAGTGAGGSSTAGGKSTALIVAADTPTTFSTQWVTFAQSGIAIGIQTAKITVNKTLTDRVYNADDVTVRVNSPEGTVLGSGATGATTTATTGAITVLPRTDGAVFTLDEIATAGSGTNLDVYQRNWSCTNSTPGSATVLPSGSTTSVGVAPEVGDNIVCTITNTGLPHDLTVEKSSDAGTETRVGDTVNYTVVVTNSGPTDFIASEPATATDDLSDVLDDAAYNDDVDATSGSAEVVGDLLSWEGALASGDSATITYSVTLEPGGDGEVTNTACVPNPGEEPTCDSSDPLLLPRLTLDKSASTQTLPAVGDPLAYTVVVTNEGPGDYTVANPASFSDDLTEVLDDATFTVGSLSPTTGTAQYAEPTVSWEGALAAGDSATITYNVTYTGAGDHQLDNSACLTANDVAPGAEVCDTVGVPGAALSQSKTVDPADGTSVVAGQEITYTLLFENDGPVDAAVDTSDDASGVFDDATLTSGPTSSDPGLTATLNGDSIDVLGTVPSAGVVTITYTVTVNEFAEQDDHVLGNVLLCPDADPTCEESTTENPIRHLTVTKSSEPTTGVQTGDTITYTVIVANDGTGDYSDENPARVVDDLTDVVDDARYNEDVDATAGTISYSAPLMTWSHPLAAGDSERFTYTVLVTNAGDHDLLNSAAEDCDPETICDPAAVVEHPLPHVVPSKTSDPASGESASSGDVITYTLSWTNDGQAPGVVDSSDDLSDVLDDATITSGPTPSNPDLTATVDGDFIDVAGPIGVGATVTVTYAVTILPDGEHGNNVVGNVLRQDVPAEMVCDVDANCGPPEPPVTEHLIGELDEWKTVDPASGATVRAGNTITYTLHFQNIGAADVPVNNEDVLTAVLDDATLTGAPTTSDNSLTVSDLVDGRLAVAGALEPDQVATVTYTVTVKPDGQRGDSQLGNFLVDPGAEPPATCAPTDPDRPDCTVNTAANANVMAMTGSTVMWSVVFTALLLLMTGAGALVIRHRRA
jgi:uncharacterized repeat protein (TIGR01451 family)